MEQLLSAIKRPWRKVEEARQSQVLIQFVPFPVILGGGLESKQQTQGSDLILISPRIERWVSAILERFPVASSSTLESDEVIQFYESHTKRL